MFEHPGVGVWDCVAAVPDAEGRGRGGSSLLCWVEVMFWTLVGIHGRKARGLAWKFHELLVPNFGM